MPLHTPWRGVIASAIPMCCVTVLSSPCGPSAIPMCYPLHVAPPKDSIEVMLTEGGCSPSSFYEGSNSTSVITQRGMHFRPCPLSRHMCPHKCVISLFSQVAHVREGGRKQCRQIRGGGIRGLGSGSGQRDDGRPPGDRRGGGERRRIIFSKATIISEIASYLIHTFGSISADSCRFQWWL